MKIDPFFTPLALLLIIVVLFQCYETTQTTKKIKQLTSQVCYLDSLYHSKCDIDLQMQCLLRGNPDSAIILHQVRCESGNYASNQFRKNNNLFGFHDGTKYLHFDHWRDSYDFFMEKFYCDRQFYKSYCAFARARKFGSNGHVNYCTAK